MYEALTNVLPFFNNHRHYERGEDAYQAVLAVLAKAEEEATHDHPNRTHHPLTLR